MPPQLPPRPEGQISGFPYSILWEEFGQIWESLDLRRQCEKDYEALLAQAIPLKLSLATEPSRAAIRGTIQALELRADAAEELEDKLYCIAAAYRIPKLKKELGLGAAATKLHLAKVAAAATKFAALLQETPLEQEVVLGLLRSRVDQDSNLPVFHFKHLISEASGLASAAKMMAEEIPQMPRGTSTDILQPRLMEAASRAIGAFANDFLEVLQADTAGRNPRPKSTSARVLFAYLKLVDPSLTNITIVRLFKAHSLAPKSITIKQLQGLPPKSWPQHEAHKKLSR